VNRYLQAQQFTFRYEDTDTLMTELQEFFPYAELADLHTQKQDFETEFGTSDYPLLVNHSGCG
jgi:hypothetical protein